ncbi:MAG: ROK family protein [Dehalococcoidales bacterium]|nr:MAG: ROK family protein [Dehalococcoidales bacterium]
MSEHRETRVIGIDLGGTNVRTAVVNAQGEMLARDQGITPAKEGSDAIVKAILESVGRVLTQAHMDASDLGAVGLASAGLSNPETGILYTSPNLPTLKDVPLAGLIEKELGKKVFLMNDANAAAIGELYLGTARGARNFIYVTLSTGIGAGVVINDKIYAGSAGLASEPGHMVISDEGPVCYCGSKGCWEPLASGTALAKYARQCIQEGIKTSILDYVGGDAEKVTAEDVHKAAQAGDALAREVIARTAYYVGVGLANLINIFNPELIVIGGGLSNIGDMLLEPAYEEAKRRAFPQMSDVVRFARAELGEDSGILGAGIFVLRETKGLGRL